MGITKKKHYITAFSEEQQEIIRAIQFEQHSSAEIAEITGLKARAVRYYLKKLVTLGVVRQFIDFDKNLRPKQFYISNI